MLFRFVAAACALLLLPACEQEGIVSSHVPVTVAGVTYMWPYDGSDKVAPPSKWSDHEAWLSTPLWNAMLGTIPSIRRRENGLYNIINLVPAKTKSWSIKPDGGGLPLASYERFKPTSREHGYTLGLGVGEGIVDPSVIAIFDGEPNAYLQCRSPGPHNPKGYCILLLNDRGVQHSTTIPYGIWADIPGILLLYRKMIGAPTTL